MSYNSYELNLWRIFLPSHYQFSLCISSLSNFHSMFHSTNRMNTINEHHKRLKENAPKLSRHMDIEGSLLSILVAKDVITEDQCNAIKSEVCALLIRLDKQMNLMMLQSTFKMTRKVCHCRL